jgi:peptide deformylase
MLTPLDITDTKLRTVCKPVSKKELRSEQLQEAIEDLLHFVYSRNNKGEGSNRNRPTTIGLSANQVGVMMMISIVDLAVRRHKYSDIHVILNPKIIWKSKTMNVRREGCVNSPGIFGMVPRHNRVKVSYGDRWGNKYVIDAYGWDAVLLQHEIDHLNGILFIDRLEDPTKAHRVNENNMRAYKKGYKNWNKFIDVSQWRK